MMGTELENEHYDGIVVPAGVAEQVVHELEQIMQTSGFSMRDYSGPNRCIAYVAGSDPFRAESVMIDDGNSAGGRLNIVVRQPESETGRFVEGTVRNILSDCGVEPDQALRNTGSDSKRRIYCLWKERS